MRWQMGRRSENVEDRRGRGGGLALGGGGTLVLALVVWALGGDPMAVLSQSMSQPGTQTRQVSPAAEQEEMDFVSAILANTEDVWSALSPVPYVKPVLVVYRGATETACGYGQSAMGPFYCPLDRRLYLDLGFFDDLQQRLHAPGDFARAYVIAHEVGHHVQTLMGTSAKVRAAQSRAGSNAAANALSVRLELQADCYAGVWGHHARADYDMLDPGDAEEALNAASQIGDDRLMRQRRGGVVPDSFTHGSSAQRIAAFRAGFQAGRIEACPL